MKRVYQLSEELEHDPEYVALTQALTRDERRLHMGRKGSQGLFASEEWWNNIRDGRMPVRRISGIVKRTLVTGQDGASSDNSIELSLPDGSVHYDSMYANDPRDFSLFRPGSRVEMVFALDEKKERNADGTPTYLDIVLEVSVSLQPAIG